MYSVRQATSRIVRLRNKPSAAVSSVRLLFVLFSIYKPLPRFLVSSQREMHFHLNLFSSRRFNAIAHFFLLRCRPAWPTCYKPALSNRPVGYHTPLLPASFLRIGRKHGKETILRLRQQVCLLFSAFLVVSFMELAQSCLIVQLLCCLLYSRVSKSSKFVLVFCAFPNALL